MLALAYRDLADIDAVPALNEGLCGHFYINTR